MTDQAPPQTPEKKKGPGCGTFLAIGCASVALIVAIAGFILVKNWDKIWPKLAGKGTELVAASALEQLGVPKEERAKAMVPIRKLSEKIATKEITGKQFGTIMETLFDGPLPAVILIRVAEINYLDPSKLPKAEKEAGRLSLNRFARGLIEETIPKEKADEIMKIVTYEQKAFGNDTGNTQLKERLTLKELRECLAIMKQAADESKVPNEKFTVDIAAEISKAIDKGLSQQPKKEG